MFAFDVVLRAPPRGLNDARLLDGACFVSAPIERGAIVVRCHRRTREAGMCEQAPKCDAQVVATARGLRM